MTHRGPFQPLPFCDSVILIYHQDNNSRLVSVKVAYRGKENGVKMLDMVGIKRAEQLIW